MGTFRIRRWTATLVRFGTALLVIVTMAVARPGPAKADSVAYSGWDGLGGVSLGAPAVTTWGPGRLDLFVRGSDHNVWHRQFAAAWGGWESLGAPAVGMASDPAAVAMRPGRVDLFVQGGDGQLWHRWYENGWSGWEPLGGGLTSAPTVTSWASGRLDVFVRGTDHQLWHKWYNGGWSGWEPLGGVLASAASGVSWGPGRIDVVAAGTDGQLWHKWYGAGWSAWEPLGGQLVNGPGVASFAPGRLDIYVEGTDNNLWHRWYAAGWSSWTLASAGPITSGPGVVSWGPGRVDVFALGDDQSVSHLGGDVGPGGGTLEPNPPGNMQIAGLSCVSATFCMAVGQAGDGSGPLVERWNGQTWTPTPAMNLPDGGSVAAVACTSAISCMAVGRVVSQGAPTQPLAFWWDGAQWTSRAVPQFSSGLGGGFSHVACPSASQCVANGNSFSSIFVSVWPGGASWSPFGSVEAGASPQLSCPAVNDCVGVGGFEGPADYTVVVWNGSTWTAHAFPTGGDPFSHPGGLSGVSCPTVTTCIVTGTNGSGAATGGIWDGTTLTLTPVPGLSGPSTLGTVSCTSAVSCTAIGSDVSGAVVEHWNGVTWARQPAPRPIGASSSAFLGVSCVPLTCAVFGAAQEAGGPAGVLVRFP